MTKAIAALALLLSFCAIPLAAQSVNATLTGRVIVDGHAAPGVTVSVSSPALQAARTATSGSDGDYTIPALPPGVYVVRFDLQGLQSVAKSTQLRLAETTRVDAEMKPAALQETVTVRPTTQSVLATPEVTTNFSSELIELLPVGRGIVDTVALAPGVQDTGPAHTLVINGAQAYDNLYLVNGVTITDQNTGQPHKLFIEDAIQETTVMTGGISAEYGRFTGGVVNVITKSGGNELSGSLRDTLSSDKWTARTPYAFEPEHAGRVNNDDQGTVGGRVIRDALWYFLAGRYAKRDQAQSFFILDSPYVQRDDERRYEAKLTASLARNHTLVGSYMQVRLAQSNIGFGAADPGALYDTVTPNSLLSLHYTGVLTRDFVLEGQYSRKTYDISGGSPQAPPSVGTPIVDLETFAMAYMPPFCSNCGLTSRDNHEALLKGSWFVSAGGLGNHSVTAGASDFHEIYSADHHESPSDFFLNTELFARNGQIYAHVVPGETTIEWDALLLPQAQAADYATRSAYVNDRIEWGSHVSVNLGGRYDANTGHDSLGNLTAKDSRISPRIGAIWDPAGDGRNRVSASYSQYVSKVQLAIASGASDINVPAILTYDYEGPELNADPNHLLSTPDVLKQVFAWFDANGGTANNDLLLSSVFSAGAKLGSNLVAPVAREKALGYGRQFGTRGAARVDWISRRWSDFYVRHITPSNGTYTDLAGIKHDLVLVDNSNTGLHRRYEGVLLQGTYKITSHMYTGGNYTWSKLWGNVEGETAGASVASAISSPADYYTEYLGFAANHPVGWLRSDVRHRGRVWVGYDIPTSAGRFNVSLLEQYHSGRPYSYTATIDISKVVPKNPGYFAPPRTATYFINGRGAFRSDDISSTGIGLNWARRVRDFEIFAEADILNVFNRQGLEVPPIASARTSRNDRNLVAFNPYTTTPIECPVGTPTSGAQCKGIANYQLGPAGATSAADYQTPRTYGFSIGARF